jgi:hypothetical protein
MLIVGPSQQCAPFAMHSFPRSSPASRSRGLSQVAARAVPQGSVAVGVPLNQRVPQIPFGPSLRRILGRLRSGMGWVCQKSFPVKSIANV